MQLQIRTRGIELEAGMRRQLERRIRLAAGRHASVIGVVTVTVRSLEVGGTRCEIRVQTRSGPDLLLAEEADDPRALIARAAWRLDQRLDRARLAAGLRVAWGERPGPQT